MMEAAEQQRMFPQMYNWVVGKLERDHHGAIPTVLEVLAYIMVMTGEDITQLVELMKEMEKSDDQ